MTKYHALTVLYNISIILVWSTTPAQGRNIND